MPVQEAKNLKQAQEIMDEVDKVYKRIKKSMLEFPNTEFAENEFSGINPTDMINFVENVPGSSLIDFVGKKLPGSMDFMHIIIASNLNCTKFFTEDNGVLKLNSYHQKGNLQIVKPCRE